MNNSRLRRSMVAVAIVGALGLGMIGNASAHCDSVDGPVITEASKALESGNITPLLKWVPADDEAAIKSAFAQARQVRQKGPEARKVADMHFYETLVQIHRASEGAPYTGIKPAGGIDPAVAAADAALVDGNIDALIAEITSKIEHNIRERHQAARTAKATAGASTANGRAFVNNYVQYVHYVENVHNAVAAGAAHGAEGGDAHGHDAAKATHVRHDAAPAKHAAGHDAAPAKHAH